MKPTSPAAATQPTCSIGTGLIRRRMDSTPAMMADRVIIAITNSPGEVFGTAEPVGVAPGGGLGAERERDPQRDGGQGVGEVVDGVGQQRDRPGDQHDHQLGDRGRAQREQADLHRPDTGGTGFQRAVDAVGGVVAVRGEHLPQRGAELAAAPAVAMVRDCGLPVVVFVVCGVRSASWVMLGVPSVGPGSSRRRDGAGVQRSRVRRRRGDGRVRPVRRARR